MNSPMLQQAASGQTVQADHNESAGKQTMSRSGSSVNWTAIRTGSAIALAFIGLFLAALTWLDGRAEARIEAVGERITRVDARAEQRDAQLREDIKALDAKLDEVLVLIRQR